MLSYLSIQKYKRGLSPKITNELLSATIVDNIIHYSWPWKAGLKWLNSDI